MILVIWAASFGVTEYGIEEPVQGLMDIQRNKERVIEMLHEVLYWIDMHGILRKPSWDGVRALLLVIPLTQGNNISLKHTTLSDQSFLASQKCRHPLRGW